MNEFSWQAVYAGDLQSVYALLIAPLAFLAWRLAATPDPDDAAVPGAARFVSGLTFVFAIETMIDPIATGPLLRFDALAESPFATLIPFVFVLLGDWRVLLLVLGVARPERNLAGPLVRSLVLSLIVPIFAGVSFAIARWIAPDLPGQVLWMFYEFGFFALCIGLARIWLPRTLREDPTRARFVQSVLGYSAAYYALWLFADFLIVVCGSDAGWAVRIVPNQLYYAFWVPFVYFRFFGFRAGKAAR